MIERRAWNWVDWAMFGLFSTLFMVQVLSLWLEPDELGVLTFDRKMVYLGWFVVSYLLPLFFWRPGYTHKLMQPILMVVLYGSIQIYMSYTTQMHVNFVSVAAIIALFVIDRRFIPWMAVILIGGLGSLDFILFDKLSAGNIVWSFVDRSILFAFGYSVRRIYDSNERNKLLLKENQIQYSMIQQQNRALEQYSRQIEQITLLEERNRMARELHDTVGHTFTSVIMGLDAVSYLLESGSPKAKEKLDVLRSVTRNGLDEVRRNIHQIAPDEEEATLSQHLARIANEFALHTGTKITIKSAGTELETSKQARLTLIRCLQESLTNAKRHGSASSVEVLMAFSEEQIQLSISDDGIGSDATQHGFGLHTMKERLSSIQGFLRFESAPGAGTTVTCTIPIRRPSDDITHKATVG